MKSLFTVLLFGLIPFITLAQPSITWDKSLGSTSGDGFSMMFKDKNDKIVVVGHEPHVDPTGNFVNYMFMQKLDTDGNVIWKKLHNMHLELFIAPYDVRFERHFEVIEGEQDLYGFQVSSNNKSYFYWVDAAGGELYSYLELPHAMGYQSHNRIQASVGVYCTQVGSCYGADSLVVDYFDPNFNFQLGELPRQYTVGARQTERPPFPTGYYIHRPQDIHIDTAGNLYLLTQVEKWDFQFCTDCNSTFDNAYSMIYKYDTSGVIVASKRLKIAQAQVTNMHFVKRPEDNSEIVVMINDINSANTKVITSVYFIDGSSLNITKQFNLDEAYNQLVTDNTNNLYGIRWIHEDVAPTHGLTDYQIKQFNPNGQVVWSKLVGGSGWDFGRSICLMNDGGLVVAGNAESNDFDVSNALGSDDVWLLKLGGTISTDEDQIALHEVRLFPNPASQSVTIAYDGTSEIQFQIVNMLGQTVLSKQLTDASETISIASIPAGIYEVLIADKKGSFVAKKLIISR